MKKLQSLCCFMFIALFLLHINSEADAISARAAIAIGGERWEILYAKNPTLKLQPASTTKLVTAIVVMDKISPDSVITISRNAANTPFTNNLKSGDRFTVRCLLYLALLESSNGATVALAEAVAGSERAFVTLMNRRAAQLGAKNTRFANSSGLPGGKQHTTVYDLAKIMNESIGYPLIREIINTRGRELSTRSGRSIFTRSTNQLLWDRRDMIGGKTGFTRAAKHGFAGVARKGQSNIITVVLGAPSRSNLWRDTNLLLAKGYSVLSRGTGPVIHFSNATRRNNHIKAAKFLHDRAVVKEEIVRRDRMIVGSQVTIRNRGIKEAKSSLNRIKERIERNKMICKR